MNLTENFTLEELCKSGVASRKGLDNTPDSNQIANLERLAWLLEKVRAKLRKPIVINSAFRSIDVNKAVGGAKNSQHLYGCAADIRVGGMRPDQVMDCIIDAKLPYDQLILEYDSWVHVSVPNTPASKPRKQALVINSSGVSPYVSKKPIKPKPEIQKPIMKTRTVGASTVVASTGGITAAVGAASAASPAMPFVSDIVDMAQRNTGGFFIVIGLLLASFAIYMIYLKIDDHRKHQWLP